MNSGSGFVDNGLLKSGEKTRFRDITDGLSSTAMFAECVIGGRDFPYKQRDDAVARQDPNRYAWHLARSWKPGEELSFIQHCLNRQNHLTILPGLANGSIQMTAANGVERPYSHFVPPNRPGCLNTPPDELLSFGMAIPPTSFHTGGVNLLLCDGVVRFISDSMDLETWRNLGSRNGNDRVGSY